MKRKNIANMIKVVYFDEYSALDLLNMLHGGELATEEQSSSGEGMKGEAKLLTEIGIGKKLFGLAKAYAGVSASAGVSTASEKTIQKTISNTVLTDYLNLKDLQSVKVLSNFEVYPDKESFAYLKLFAPYLQMFNIEEQGLNVDRLDDVLINSKGYYELIASNRENQDEKHILRFNINAFRNNYGLIDLTKMKLEFHAIEVGEGDLSSVKFSNEFQTNDEIIQSDDLINETNQICKIYDVLFAGVKAEAVND